MTNAPMAAFAGTGAVGSHPYVTMMPTARRTIDVTTAVVWCEPKAPVASMLIAARTYAFEANA
jgi:hypothetical protein